ncbi:uncharacterized protein [Triticum aestivum]|uniref:uncharacterized protein isoform X2 n=1 Tax=Triticum aestivum TaxID=4565 RepID=UPI001D004AB4|nr:uncharacterized protein LOC123072150 isoform X2 [Triticum aestivum]
MLTGIAAMAIFTGCALRSNSLHHASEKKLCAGLNTLGISVSCNILFGEFVTSRPEWLCMDQNMNEGYFSNIYVEIRSGTGTSAPSSTWSSRKAMDGGRTLAPHPSITAVAFSRWGGERSFLMWWPSTPATGYNTLASKVSAPFGAACHLVITTQEKGR